MTTIFKPKVFSAFFFSLMVKFKSSVSLERRKNNNNSTEKTVPTTSPESNCFLLWVSLSFFVISHTHSYTHFPHMHTLGAVLIKAARCVRLYRCVAARVKPAPCGGHRPGSWCAKPLALRHLNRSIWAPIPPLFLYPSPSSQLVSPRSDLLLSWWLCVCVCLFMDVWRWYWGTPLSIDQPSRESAIHARLSAQVVAG